MLLKLTKRRLAVVLLAALLPAPALASPIAATLYKNPECMCCEAYAKYLTEHGFKVTIISSHDNYLINQKAGVPDDLEGCHVTLIDGYLIEGHVPIDAIQKLLAERPKIIGISIPGMPPNLPGMPGQRSEPVPVYEIVRGGGAAKVFVTEP
jgi:hypothetical protein